MMKNPGYTIEPVTYVRLFLSFIADTVSWLKNIMLACGKLLQQSISELEFYGDFVNRIRTSGLGPDAMSLTCPTVVQLVVSFGLQWGIS